MRSRHLGGCRPQSSRRDNRPKSVTYPPRGYALFGRPTHAIPVAEDERRRFHSSPPLRFASHSHGIHPPHVRHLSWGRGCHPPLRGVHPRFSAGGRGGGGTHPHLPGVSLRPVALCPRPAPPPNP